MKLASLAFFQLACSLAKGVSVRTQVQLSPNQLHARTNRSEPHSLRSIMELQYREATSADVPAMERSRAADAQSGPADMRMAAYFDGKHHPQQALAARTGFVALDGPKVVGYIAAHATTRFACAGEVQYLYVAPDYRRCGVGRQLLQCVALWFRKNGIARVCVNADIESVNAVPFYKGQGAKPLNTYWYVWDDIGVVARHEPSQ